MVRSGKFLIQVDRTTAKEMRKYQLAKRESYNEIILRALKCLEKHKGDVSKSPS